MLPSQRRLAEGGHADAPEQPADNVIQTKGNIVHVSHPCSQDAGSHICRQVIRTLINLPAPIRHTLTGALGTSRGFYGLICLVLL